MTVKDLQMRDSALHRIEVELDCARTDLERSKIQSEKSDGQSRLQVCPYLPNCYCFEFHG